MQRFILRENIARFESLLRDGSCRVARRTLLEHLAAARRELARLDAAELGAGLPFAHSRLAVHAQPLVLRKDAHVQRRLETTPVPALLLDPRPGLHIVDCNEPYARATGIAVSKVGGQQLFEVFPDNPDDPQADGVSNLFASLKTVAETGQAHVMPVQRYDVRGPDGSFDERYWLPLNLPVFDAAGNLSYILHHVEDITQEMFAKLKNVA